MRFASAKAQPGGGVEENSDTGGGPPQLLDEDDAPCGAAAAQPGDCSLLTPSQVLTHSQLSVDIYTILCSALGCLATTANSLSLHRYVYLAKSGGALLWAASQVDE